MNHEVGTINYLGQEQLSHFSNVCNVLVSNQKKKRRDIEIRMTDIHRYKFLSVR